MCIIWLMEWLLNSVGVILLYLVGLGVLGAVLWCLYDVIVKASDIDIIRRVLWVLVLIGLNAIGAILYVRLGPGRERWSPWTFWRPTKTD